MSFFKVLVVALLIALIGLTLFQNKQEIDAEVAMAELEVAAWPVITQGIAMGTLQDRLTATGVLQPTRELRLFARIPGVVTALNKAEGSTVKKGDIIARIDDSSIRTQLEVSNAVLKQAKTDLARMENLGRGEAVTPQQLEQARLRVSSEESKNEELQRRLSDTRLTAGIGGTIARLGFKEGEFVGPGQPIGLIADLSQLQVKIAVSPNVSRGLKTGQQVMVAVNDYPVRPFEGSIGSIAPHSNDGFKYEVEVILESDDRLLTGMFATITIEGAARDAMVIPREAVLGGYDTPYVYLEAGGKAVQRTITLGQISDDQVEVVDGLEVNEQLIIAGHRNLSDGVAVSIRAQ